MKKAGITGIPAGKKKDETFFVLSQKQRYVFLSVPTNISRKKKRSLKKYRINV